jgi:hypothetical protein
VGEGEDWSENRQSKGAYGRKRGAHSMAKGGQRAINIEVHRKSNEDREEQQ